MSELPSSWVEVRLDDVAEVRLGRQRSPKNHWGSRMRPYLRAANVTWDGLDLSDVKEMNFTENESAIYELRGGDVLVAEASGSADEVGKPALWRGEISNCCFQNTLVRVRASGVLPEYLRYFLLAEARSGRIGQSSPGVGIHHIGAARLSAWVVPLPPLAEQPRIVAAIEEQLSRLEAGLAALDAARQRCRVVWRSVLADAMGGWPQRKLVELVEVLDSQRVPVNRDERATRPGSVPYYGATGQVGWIDHPLFNERLVLLGEDGAPFLERDKAKAYVIDGPSWVNNHAHVLRARTDVVLPDFLKHALNCVDYHAFVTGTTRLKLTQAAMREIELPVPDLEAQNLALEKLETTESAITTVSSQASDAERRAETLRRSILAGAFRGELVPQDSDDEPASVLLERIAAERAAAPRPERKRRDKAPA